MKQLYRVTLTGMKSSISGPAYGCSYVIADSMDFAYEIVRDFLDKNNLGFHSDRVLEKIELIAEAKRYPECGTILFGAGFDDGGRSDK
jgi:hypothetical protein